VSEKKYGVVPAEVLTAQDGLAFLQAMIAGSVPNPPMSETLGFHLTEVEHGRAVFEGLPEYRHYNPIGSVHGGFAATLLDSALGCAVFSTLARGEKWTTLELK
jgi:acyl-coenzyme A thioesterase PaaI-like protein